MLTLLIILLVLVLIALGEIIAPSDKNPEHLTSAEAWKQRTGEDI